MISASQEDWALEISDCQAISQAWIRGTAARTSDFCSWLNLSTLFLFLLFLLLLLFFFFFLLLFFFFLFLFAQNPLPPDKHLPRNLALVLVLFLPGSQSKASTELELVRSWCRKHPYEPSFIVTPANWFTNIQSLRRTHQTPEIQSNGRLF